MGGTLAKDGTLCRLDSESVPYFLNGLVKTLVGNGFKQVIDRVQIKTFHRIIVISSGKNYQGRVAQ